MKRSSVPVICAVIAAAAVIVLLGWFLAADMLAAVRGTNIVLPTGSAVTTAADQRGEVLADRTVLAGVEVTPENVAAVISTLSRPDAYTLTAQVERTANEHGRITLVTHAVHGDMSATRSTCAGRTSGVLRADGLAYLWQDDGAVTTLNEGSIGEHAAAGLPDYTVVHTLASISDAGYTVWEGFDCIWFEGRDDALGLVSRYYVDIATGLLIASHTDCRGQTVYRMHTETITVETPGPEAFTLPDGRCFMEQSPQTAQE